MRVAITGASGFLGSAFTTRLRADRSEIEVVSVGRDDALPLCDLVVHLAGGSGIEASLTDPQADREANLEQTVRRLAEAADIGTGPVFMLASSCAVYGAAAHMPVVESTPPDPQSPYGESKAAAESAVLASPGVRPLIARIANPIGPGQRRLVAYDLARRALEEGPPLHARGTGEEVRDFIDVDDVARALLLLALAASDTESVEEAIYNVGSGVPVSLRELAEMIAVEAGFGADDVLFEGIGEPGKVDVFVPDVGRLRSLGFAPAHDLRSSIARTVAWVRG